MNVKKVQIHETITATEVAIILDQNDNELWLIVCTMILQKYPIGKVFYGAFCGLDSNARLYFWIFQKLLSNSVIAMHSGAL